VSTLEEIKAAAAALNPEEQVELFRWWTQSDIFKARQLNALKRDIALGIKQLEQGQYRVLYDANLMQLAEEVGTSGRQQLESKRRQPPA
jgi:hypothetical protein